MLRLIPKLPKGKDPVLCVCFSSYAEARRTNEELILDHKHEQYALRLQPVGKLMNLKLWCPSQEKVYRGLEFDFQKLKNWLQLVEGCKQFKFCHIVMEENKHKVVQAINNNWFVLNANSCTSLSELQFSF